MNSTNHMIYTFHWFTRTVFNSRSKCADTSHILRRYWHMQCDSQPHWFWRIQYDRPIVTVVCGRNERQYRYCTGEKKRHGFKAANINVFIGNSFDFLQIYLTLEQPNPNPFDCPSESIHGVCPMRLAQFKGDDNMIDLLRSKHQLHIMKVSAIRWAIHWE